MLKIFKVFPTNSVFINWPFLGGFVLLFPQIMSDFTEIFTRDSILVYNNTIWIIFEKLELLRKRHGEVCLFGPTLTPCFTVKMAKKFSYRAIKICKSQDPISSPLQMKNRITFYTFRIFLGKNRAWWKVKKSES